MFSLICNVSIQNAQAAAFIFQLMNGCPWETIQCFVAENLWLQWGGGFGEHLNLQPHDKFSTNWNLNYQDQMLSTSCFLILTMVKRDIQGGYLFVVLIFKMIPVHWQRHFILTEVEWMVLRNFFATKFFCDKNVSLVGGCQSRTLGFMPNALPFEVDSDLSLCQTE